MAASIVPTDYLAGYTYLANGAAAPAAGIFIPLTTLTGLDASEADAATGDIRKIARSVFDALYTSYAAKTEAPSKFNILRSRNPSFSGTDLMVEDSYTVTVSLTGTIGDVAAE